MIGSARRPRRGVRARRRAAGENVGTVRDPANILLRAQGLRQMLRDGTESQRLKAAIAILKLEMALMRGEWSPDDPSVWDGMEECEHLKPCWEEVPDEQKPPPPFTHYETAFGRPKPSRPRFAEDEPRPELEPQFGQVRVTFPPPSSVGDAPAARPPDRPPPQPCRPHQPRFTNRDDAARFICYDQPTDPHAGPPGATMRPALFALLALAGPAPAAVVAVQNRTAQPITFAVLHGEEKRQVVTLAPGDTTAVPVGRDAQLIVTRDKKNERFKLDPWTPYVFLPAGSSFDFQGIKLAADLPKADDVPALPSARKPIPVPVTLHLDGRDGRVKAVWGKALRERFAAAAAPLEAQLGVKFDTVDSWEWKASAEPGWDHAMEHFRTSVEAQAGGLAVGFLAKPVAKGGDQFVAAGRPWRSHLLLLEGYPRTEAERVDALAQALARQFGGVLTADSNSILRENLLDGQATKPSYRPRLDPLNLLAMSVWAEEKAGGHKLTWEDLRPTARARLLAVYKTLAQLPSKDPTATEYVEALAAGKDVVLPPTPAATPDPVRKLGDRDAAVWAVVQAVSNTAKKLADDPKRPKGDDLTLAYVRAAAAAADAQPAEHAAPAFLIGLGVALDDSTVLRANPLTKKMCERVETDDERKGRLAALGTPTVRGRRDLCQHFVVSVALVQLIGADGAEFAGLTKELNDGKGASGFSFVDLSADYAGVAFARAVAADAKLLGKLKDGFAVADWVPTFDGLREGLPEAKFAEQFGGPDDDRFKKVVADIRRRVADLPGNKK